jgi:CMP-N-acetylneuraminic acid synthetase
LLAWTIAAARASLTVDRVVVSSDDIAILRAAKLFGADSLLRPPELARDDVPSAPVVLHALDAIPLPADIVVLLHPTSPFRAASDIDACVRLVERGCPAAVSMCKPARHPMLMVNLRSDGRIAWREGEPPVRQRFPDVYAVNGAVYAARVDYFREHGFVGPQTFGVLMSDERSLDIDAPFDLEIARALVAYRERERAA